MISARPFLANLNPLDKEEPKPERYNAVILYEEIVYLGYNGFGM